MSGGGGSGSDGGGGWRDPGSQTTGDAGGVHDTGPQLGPDTSTVGIAAP